MLCHIRPTFNPPHLAQGSRLTVPGRVGMTLHEVAEVVDDMCSCGAIEVVRIKDRFHEPSSGGWSDCMINYVLRDDPNRHICEVQIVHSKLMMARHGIGSHEVYAKLRGEREVLEKLGADIN